MTTNAMDTLLALKCRTCGGSKEIQVHVSRDINSPTQPQPCCGCLNLDDIPTGLLVPELVEQCGWCESGQVKDWPIWEGSVVVGLQTIPHERCHGTGLVPVSEDTALRVMMEHPNCSKVIQWSSPEKNKWEGYWGREAYDYNRVYSGGLGATPLEALAAAIKASVEVENHDN